MARMWLNFVTSGRGGTKGKMVNHLIDIAILHYTSLYKLNCELQPLYTAVHTMSMSLLFYCIRSEQLKCNCSKKTTACFPVSLLRYKVRPVTFSIRGQMLNATRCWTRNAMKLSAVHLLHFVVVLFSFSICFSLIVNCSYS